MSKNIGFRLDKTYRVAIAFMIAHFSHHVITAITAPLLPMIREDLQISYTQSGVILSAFTISYGISQLPVGWLLHRVKSYVFIFMGIAGVGVAGLLIGLTKGFFLLLTFQLVMGLMGSGYHPTGIFFISQVVEREKKGKALGIHTIGGSLSYFVSPILAAILAASWGWRGAFISLSIPIIAIGIVISLMVRKYTVDGGEEDSGKGSSHGGSHDDFNDSLLESDNSVVSGVPWFRLTIVIILSVTIGAVMGSVIGFIPLYAVDVWGMDKKLAATLVAVIFSAGFWASPLAGFLADKFGEIPLLMFAGIVAGPVVILISVLAGGFWVYFFMVMIGMTIFVRMPVTESYIIGELDEKTRATVLGFYFFASSMGGGVITPIMGWIADRRGFTESFRWTGVALVSIVFLCVILLLLDIRRQKYNN